MVWTCPHCGAAVDASAERCWACKQPRPEPEPGSRTVSLPIYEPDRKVPRADPVTESSSETGPASTSLRAYPRHRRYPPPSPGSAPSVGKRSTPVFWCVGLAGPASRVSRTHRSSAPMRQLSAPTSPQQLPSSTTIWTEPKPGPDPQHCFRCQGPLEPGFVADFQHSSMSPSQWIAGTPQRSFWSGTWTGDRRYPIQAFRCRHCRPSRILGG